MEIFLFLQNFLNLKIIYSWGSRKREGPGGNGAGPGPLSGPPGKIFFGGVGGPPPGGPPGWVLGKFNPRGRPNPPRGGPAPPFPKGKRGKEGKNVLGPPGLQREGGENGGKTAVGQGGRVVAGAQKCPLHGKKAGGNPGAGAPGGPAAGEKGKKAAPGNPGGENGGRGERAGPRLKTEERGGGRNPHGVPGAPKSPEGRFIPTIPGGKGKKKGKRGNRGVAPS